MKKYVENMLQSAEKFIVKYSQLVLYVALFWLLYVLPIWMLLVILVLLLLNLEL
jgi:hypothetical protein